MWRLSERTLTSLTTLTCPENPQDASLLWDIARHIAHRLRKCVEKMHSWWPICQCWLGTQILPALAFDFQSFLAPRKLHYSSDFKSGPVQISMSCRSSNEHVLSRFGFYDCVYLDPEICQIARHCSFRNCVFNGRLFVCIFSAQEKSVDFA